MKNSSKKGFVGITIIAIILLGVIAFGGYKTFHTTKISEDNSSKDFSTSTTFSATTTVSTTTSPTVAMNAGITLTDDQVVVSIDKDFIKNTAGHYVYKNDEGDPPFISLIAHGDINNDGYDDAIVEQGQCGATCNISFFAVINQKNGTGKSAGLVTTDLIESSGSHTTDIQKITINNGIITMTGQGFKGSSDWNVVATKTFRVQGNTLVEVK